VHSKLKYFKTLTKDILNKTADELKTSELKNETQPKVILYILQKG